MDATELAKQVIGYTFDTKNSMARERFDLARAVLDLSEKVLELEAGGKKADAMWEEENNILRERLLERNNVFRRLVDAESKVRRIRDILEEE